MKNILTLPNKIFTTVALCFFCLFAIPILQVNASCDQMITENGVLGPKGPEGQGGGTTPPSPPLGRN